MTYASDIDKRRHRPGYYIAFDGIPTRLGTHDFGAAPYSLSGTFLRALTGAPRGGPQKLDRRRGLVLPDGFSVEAVARTAVHQVLRRRGGDETTLVTTLAPDDTDIALADETLAEGTALYLDRETIVLGPFNAVFGTYTGCTRGAYDSVAASHTSGAVASTVPRYWKGRRAVLYAVNLETGSEQAVRAGLLSKSPRFRNGAYELAFTDLQRELARPINSGWLPERVLERTVDANGDLVCTVRNAAAFVDDTVAGQNYVKASFGDGFELFRLVAGSVDIGADTVTLHRLSFIHSTLGTESQVETAEDLELQQVLYLVGDPAMLALILMLSVEGDVTNHGTYDLLAGRTAVTGVTPRRQGAGIPAAWVDVDSWEEAIGGPQTTLFSDEPEVLLDVLVDECLWHLGGKLFINGSGQLAFRQNMPAVPQSSIPVIDGSNRLISDVECDDDESQILALAAIECNWDPATRKYGRKVAVHFEDTAPIYGEDLAGLDIRSRTTWVGPASPSPLVSPPFGDETALTVAFDRYGARTRRGLRRTSLALPWSMHLDAIPGWAFKLTHPQLPDGEGGVGVTERQYEAVSASPAYETGRVTIEAEEMQPGWLVAPSFVVAASGDNGDGTYDVTADTSGDEADLFDEKPPRDFPAGATVRIYDSTGDPPFKSSVTGTITSLSDDGMTFEAEKKPAGGDLVVLENSANTGNANAANADVQDHLFLADDDGVIDAGGATERDGNTWA